MEQTLRWAEPNIQAKGSFMGLVITIGGLHGTGKTTYAKSLSEHLGLRHVSAGDLFRRLAEDKGLTLEGLAELAELDHTIDREIDNRIIQEAERGDVVLDGQLAAWMVDGKTDLKILLITPREVRFKRIAEREGLTVQEAETSTLRREEAERRRYMNIYGVDVSDPSIYDLIVDTNLYPLQGMKKILNRIVSDYIQTLKKRRGDP
ncbi:MAG: (d)CMP kinase [Candidatus Bathyarchaeia archaeon]